MVDANTREVQLHSIERIDGGVKSSLLKFELSPQSCKTISKIAVPPSYYSFDWKKKMKQKAVAVLGKPVHGTSHPPREYDVS